MHSFVRDDGMQTISKFRKFKTAEDVYAQSVELLNSEDLYQFRNVKSIYSFQSYGRTHEDSKIVYRVLTKDSRPQ